MTVGEKLLDLVRVRSKGAISLVVSTAFRHSPRNLGGHYLADQLPLRISIEAKLNCAMCRNVQSGRNDRFAVIRGDIFEAAGRVKVALLCRLPHVVVDFIKASAMSGRRCR